MTEMSESGRYEGARLLLAWIVTLAAAAVALNYAWHQHDHRERPDGNDGHAQIDFGGQWVMGRMIVEGHGRQLYRRDVQGDLIRRAFPIPPDAEELIGQFMVVEPAESQVGGPLYPPIQALLYSPLGLLPPQPAFRLMQVFNQALILALGLVVSRLTGGRIWWPVAAFLLMIFPGYAGAVNLAQNSVLSLALLTVGWLLVTRGRPVAAGVVWGFLAFKPVWAASFFLVPLLTRRWRVAAAMALTGTALVLATLPVVGIGAWFEWLAIGRVGSGGYEIHTNWIILSRDLSGLPRRWLLTFPVKENPQPLAPLATALGLAIWLGVTTATVLVALRHRREPAPVDGPGAAFVLLGAYFSCFHFIFYDALVAALPVLLLFSRRPWPRVPAAILAAVIGLVYLTNALDPTCKGPPWDTYGLLLIWAWCGWTWRGSDSCSGSARET
jgi:hypothetical protein